MNHQAQDEHWMTQALELAGQALGRTWPNPMVGAIVLDRQGQQVGAGYHLRTGLPHAEALALATAGQRAQGGTLYVTLEPCHHHGRTPPCVEAVLASGVQRVVIAMPDPDLRTAGQSIAKLQAAGLDVSVGVLAAEAARLNRPFIRSITQGLPWITWKYAMTLDGRIATATGHSRWISSPALRGRVHLLRLGCDVILTGIGTVLVDDPLLNCRHPLAEPADQPRRVVLDGLAQLPLTSRLVTTAQEQPVTVMANPAAPPERVQALQARGVEVLTVPGEGDCVVVAEVARKLNEASCRRVLLECGARLAGAWFQAGLICEVMAHIAPRLVGDSQAPFPLGGIGPLEMDETPRLCEVQIEIVDDEVIITGLTDTGAGRQLPQSLRQGKQHEP